MHQCEIESSVQTVCKALANAEVYKLKNIFVLCLLSHDTGGVVLFCFPLVIMTGIDKFETSFKLELELFILFLSVDETLTLCSQICLEEPRDCYVCFCQSGMK